MVNISEDVPSLCAKKLKGSEVQLALVPVALLPELNYYDIVSKYCIGADGIVDSVKLYHNVPLDQICRVLLDYQSRTSVNLARVLFRFAWKRDVEFIDATPGFEEKVFANTAAVVIGDRTFALNGRYTYETDLAEAWKKFTGLPFVFAVWVSTEVLPEKFLQNFNAALQTGVSNIAQAVKDDYTGSVLSAKEVQEYLSDRIDYHLDERKITAMKRFHTYLSRL